MPTRSSSRLRTARRTAKLPSIVRARYKQLQSVVTSYNESEPGTGLKIDVLENVVMHSDKVGFDVQIAWDTLSDMEDLIKFIRFELKCDVRIGTEKVADSDFSTSAFIMSLGDTENNESESQHSSDNETSVSEAPESSTLVTSYPFYNFVGELNWTKALLIWIGLATLVVYFVQ